MGLDRFSGLYAIAALVIVFAILIPNTFFTTQTAKSLAGDQAITALLAIALIIPMAAGAFDLSVAGMLGFTVALVAWLQANGMNALLSVCIAIICGVLVGAINGFIVVKVGVDSFVATLGMSSILAAGTYWILQGQLIVDGLDAAFVEAGRGAVFGIPLTFIYLLVIGALIWYMLEFTALGRYFYAAGSNNKAARLAGVPVDRIRFLSLVLGAVVAAIAGVILTAKLGMADPNVGPSYLLPAFAAAFLGSTQIKPNRVNVLGTLVAIALLAVGIKGLQLMGAERYVEDLFNGLALIVAVSLASLRKRRVV